jgi:hypothetical protein
MPKVAPQTYGQGVEQQQLNMALPTPNMQTGAPTGAVAMPEAPMPEQYSQDQVMAAATGLADQTGLLNRDTTRPQEPITAGLSRGPGPGPEALGVVQGTPAGDMLRRLSASTGDPYFAELARKAQA